MGDGEINAANPEQPHREAAHCVRLPWPELTADTAAGAHIQGLTKNDWISRLAGGPAVGPGAAMFDSDLLTVRLLDATSHWYAGAGLHQARSYASLRSAPV